MPHDPQDPRTWPKSLRGYRKPTDQLIFECACGCGGHAAIERKKVFAVEEAREHTHRTFKGKDKPIFGEGYFIEGHTPVGIAGFNARTGSRTFLNATA
jgi:hypothetical protein